jgi:hypothetical protein
MPHPPRPPAFSHGTVSFLWAAGLGLFIFVGMLAISISKGTSVVVSIVSAAVIFFAVRLFGGGTGAQGRSASGGGGR